MPAASIAADLKSFLVPIDSVQPHPENARRGDVPGIAASLKAHGQYAPILVQQSTGFIVAGNHTWRGAKRNKWDSIAALHLDVSDEQALEILLVDNRLNDLAGTDQQATLAILNELESAGRLTGTGYSAKDLADLRAEIGRGTYRSPDAGTAPPDAQPPPAMSIQPWSSDSNGDLPPLAPPVMKEVSLRMTPEEHATALAHIATLRTIYGLEGVSGVVQEAVRREAANAR